LGGDFNINNFETKFYSQREFYITNGSTSEFANILSVEKLCIEHDADEVLSKVASLKLVYPISELIHSYLYAKRSIRTILNMEIVGERDVYFGISWPKSDCEQALKYLQEIETKMLDSSLLHFLLFYCYVMIGNVGLSGKHFCEFQKIYGKLNIYDKRAIQLLEAKFRPFVYMRLAEYDIITRNLETIKTSEKNLEILTDKFPNNAIAIMLLINIYGIRKKYKRAIEKLKKWAVWDTNSFANEYLGRIYFAQKKYLIASKYFDKCYNYHNKHKNYYRKILCLMFYELSKGLYCWSRGSLTQRKNINAVYKHFSNSSMLIENYKLYTLRDFGELPSILEIAYRTIDALFSSTSIYELKAKIENVFDNIQNKLKFWKSEKEHLEDLKYLGDPTTNLLTIVNTIACHVGCTLKIQKVENYIKSTIEELKCTEKKFWEEDIKMRKHILSNELGFKNDAVIFDCMILLKDKIRKRFVEEISVKEQNEIIRLIRRKMKLAIKSKLTKQSSKTNQMLFEILITMRDMETDEGENRKNLIELKKLIEEFIHNIREEAQEMKAKPEKVEQEIPKIIFGQKEVKFNTTDEVCNGTSKRMRLLKYFIFKKQIHWLNGYIIFKEWQKGNVKYHIKEFKKVVAELRGPRKGVFKKCCLCLTIKPYIYNQNILELGGNCISNIDILKDIFVKNFEIEKFVKILIDFSEKNWPEIINFLKEILIDYEAGIAAILKDKANNYINNWDEVADKQYHEIQCDKERIKGVLHKLGSITEEQITPNKQKDFEDWKSVIDFIRSFEIDEDNFQRDCQYIIKELNDDEVYRPLIGEVLKAFDKMKIESQAEWNILMRYFIEAVREIQLNIERFGTKDGLLEFLISKCKRKFYRGKYAKADVEEMYRRYNGDFENATTICNKKLNRPLSYQPSYEEIANELFENFSWTFERFWDFIAFKDERVAKPLDDEKGREKLQGDAESNKNY
jgi:hypothetical protein